MKVTRRPKLPWAVRRGIVAANRYPPPSNQDPEFRVWSRQAAERLSRLPPAVWELDIDWRKDAATLDRCADQYEEVRTLSDEAKAHGRIAAAMRKARNLLRAEGQPDPLLAEVFDALARRYSDKFQPYRLSRQHAANDATLSDFLSYTADLIEGENVRHNTVHRMRGNEAGTGRQGAAIQAAASVRWFFETRTGKPHNDLMKEIVSAYFPELAERDWASTLDKRKAAAAQRNRN